MSDERHGPSVPEDFAREGLLDGLAGAEREERLRLLAQLSADGVPLAELRRHTAEGTIVFVAAERVIAGHERYTAAEVAELAGVDLEFLLAARRATGLSTPAPDERAYIEADLESVQMANLAQAAGISHEEMLELMRTLGRGLAQSAEAMRALTLRLVLEPGVGEHELAQRYALATSQLYPMLGPLITNLLTLHLRQMAESEAISAAERVGGRLPGSREVNVCFADLVGFTRLGEQVQPDELSRLAVRLEELASSVAEQPVRLIKTIGDAVMLTSTEPQPLIDAAMVLVDAAGSEGESFPQLRAGIATGAALSRAGDWFGRPVNLASRITAIARPGSVLAEREVRNSTRDAYSWSYAGERRLRGVREPVALYRARPLASSAD
ncbi:MAG TPA: adenylate cyclase regulatory domain-containing protein [Solirubrobacteraceae bacterium]|jgi:adenylate cyclase|nr:adenylate cyclase regulatory domain-containing protein [Solirubrobacteraceae bacterium]